MNLIDKIDQTHKRVLELKEKLQQAHQEKNEKDIKLFTDRVCNMIDKSVFSIRMMETLKNREMFKNRAQITLLLERRGKTLEAKRKLIMIANSPLFYAFGYEYEPKKETEYGFGY